MSRTLRDALVVASLAIGLIAHPAAAQTAGRLTGSRHAVVVVTGDSWQSIGAREGVDLATLARDNRLSATTALKPGQTLRVDNRHVVPDGLKPGTFVVNVPQRLLFSLNTDGEIVAMPAGVGRPAWPTVTGDVSVVSKAVDPTWHVPASIREEARASGRTLPALVPPGPGNPLGGYWIGLSIAGIGIHGTNRPSSVYRPSTHACIRLRPDDIAMFFESVHTGTTGRLIYEPVLLGTDGLEVFLEVHPDVYKRGVDPVATVRGSAQSRGLIDAIDWHRVAAVIAEHAGIARRITR